jgi:MFS family permease
VGAAFALNTVSFVAVIGVLLALRLPRREILNDPSVGVLSAYWAAVRLLWANRAMRTAYVLVVIAAFLGQPMLQLVSVFAARVYHVGPTALGLLTAGFGLGAVIGAVTLARITGSVPRSDLVRLLYPVFGLAVVGFGLSRSALVGSLALVVAGAAYVIKMSACSATVQLRVPEEARGRVMGFYLLGWTAAYPIGSLLQGWLADRIGAGRTVVIAGALLTATGLGLWVRPGLARSMDDAPAG